MKNNDKTYLYDVTVTRVNNSRLHVEYVVQRHHVIVQVFEDGGTLAQNTVATEYRVLLQQMEGHVVRRVAGRVHHPQRRPLNRELLSVLQLFNWDGGGLVLDPRELPNLTVLCKTTSYTSVFISYSQIYVLVAS